MILAQQIVWATSLTLSKTSILTLYSKIFTISYFIVAAKITAVVIFLWMLVVILGSLLICQPLESNWDQTIAGHCGSSITLWMCHGVLNIVTDLIVLLLPMPYIYSLELSLYKKLVLMATFGLGLLCAHPSSPLLSPPTFPLLPTKPHTLCLKLITSACSVAIISAIRLYSILHVDMTDITYTILMPILWSALEPCLAITLACIPLLRPLLGGKYTPTGTARLGPTMKSRAATQKRGRRSNLLEDEVCITKSADEGTHLKPESIRYDFASSHSQVDVNMDTDVELSSIFIKKDWRVGKT